jgi:hypothetical protein
MKRPSREWIRRERHGSYGESEIGESDKEKWQ